ncbi:ATP-dependent helicase [Limosilactobacillus sp. RRLNB_1_1]|uniref:DNA 3'-5' helicase n=1 Tax=Limosilactobacillus albertensis TaxID=2759752 RepID=A0A7W3Y7I2_9LACO|nr:UvrD-helicase domain-containing protein [Limosilactobacillus albertensis]MBB1068699.1 ATP-dependent helicase [Limosilactobacillus albertensis]MCD7118296.1 UvrD-helicase domain-containing protein [Limosilactobacillus albertensis]MCD7129206.1 UvrD-helicase domain-containing protein [Limosilactobacillus albertensis]
MTKRKQEDEVQKKIFSILDSGKVKIFQFNAGAGAGKTYALEQSIKHLLKTRDSDLKTRNQKILCITYTNAAKNELVRRLNKNSSVVVSTIHEFLWGFIKTQQKSLIELHQNKIEDELMRINGELTKSFYKKIEEKDKFDHQVLDKTFANIFYSHYSDHAEPFRVAMEQYDFPKKWLNNVNKFKKTVINVRKRDKLQKVLDKPGRKVDYISTKNRDNLADYKISHETLLDYCKQVITNHDILKRLFMDRHPYVFIDEYQDTDQRVVDIMDSIEQYAIGRGKSSLIIGYFGDPLQNIYGKEITNTFVNDKKYLQIKKVFNRRSTTQVISVINRIRNDALKQESIYEDYNNGTNHFYSVNDDFVLDKFLDRMKLSTHTTCLLMKNEDIAKERNFDLLLTVIKKFPNFKDNNYDNINEQFLQKNIQHIGSFLRNLLSFIELIQKIKYEKDITINKILVLMYGKLPMITFNDLRDFIHKLFVFNFNSLNLVDCLTQFLKISSGKINGTKVLEYIFGVDDSVDTLTGIKNKAYDYLIGQNNNDMDVDSFFKIKFSQFINWYYYIYDNQHDEKVNYYTLHGSKGLEFDNVVVVFEDNFGHKKDYCKYFFENYDSGDVIDDERFNQVRNLLYVACSRAKQNLYVIYINNGLDSIAKSNIEKIFDKIEYLNDK